MIRARGGFDAFVGNPPFAGKNTLKATQDRALGRGGGESYADWLKSSHEGSHGNSDLVAHFYRRAFDLLRRGGTFGLVATNTIAQGDTRSTGLRWICSHGGVVYEATRRYKWPGLAAVVVSIVHIQREPSLPLLPQLDGKSVPRVSAFLFHQGGDDDPVTLNVNAGMCFLGTNVVGEGFKFDDTDKSGQASSLLAMHVLLARDHANAERIFPFIGGEEINDSPAQEPHRYIIDFGDMSEEEARRWPDLIGVLERHVRSKREAEKRTAYGKYWWRHGERRVELYDRLRRLEHAFATCQTSKYRGIVRMPARIVFSTKVVVFTTERWEAYAVLQSRAHELWALFFGSSLEDRPVYTPTDCFETYPFPPVGCPPDDLATGGLAYHAFRAALMARNGEGLTDTYNRFHDPDERSDDIVQLRRLHDEMDRAVLDAYGWTDVRPTCTFLLDYEDDEGELGSRARRRRKPWRYRWPDEMRDDVLARLLALNAERAAEEKRLGEEADVVPRHNPASATHKKPGANKRDSGPKLPGVE